MKIKQLFVYLQQNRQGIFSAHIRMQDARGYKFGSDLFENAEYLPTQAEEAMTLTKLVLASQGLIVEEIQFV
jgi:hypothetical protein